jgi:protein-S-isoprenylcysteine O-methyltransferase Ste14
MTRLRALLPLALTLLGFAVMGALFVRREAAALSASPAAAAAFAVAALTYAAWLAWESRVSAREASRAGSLDLDRGTMELAAFAKYALLAGALVPLDAPPLPAVVAGLALLALGVAARAAAVRTLGAAYSHRIRPIDGDVVARGPYALVRHPAYLGTLLAHAGIALVFCSAWSIAALLSCWLPAVLLRTVLEDRALRESPAYAAYASRVRARLLVGVF